MDAIITQARLNSNRLPNKILKTANCVSFLHHHVTRLKKTELPVIIATTNDGSEKPIIDYCDNNGVLYYRGDEENVLKRFYECAMKYNLKTIVRVTSDCPLIDGAIIKSGFEKYIQFDDINAYYSNVLNRTYPRGMDYEIFDFKKLEEAFISATESGDKEHVTPYIWKNKTGTVKILHDVHVNDNSDLRITLDTLQDQSLLTLLIEEHNAANLKCAEIVKILRDNPSLVEINKMVEQKKVSHGL